MAATVVEGHYLGGWFMSTHLEEREKSCAGCSERVECHFCHGQVCHQRLGQECRQPGKKIGQYHYCDSCAAAIMEEYRTQGLKQCCPRCQTEYRLKPGEKVRCRTMVPANDGSDSLRPCFMVMEITGIDLA